MHCCDVHCGTTFLIWQVLAAQPNTVVVFVSGGVASSPATVARAPAVLQAFYTVVACYAMLCYAMLCYAMLRYATLCYAMLCYARRSTAASSAARRSLTRWWATSRLRASSRSTA